MGFFNRKNHDQIDSDKQEDITFVDVHCHILPGVDDGSPGFDVTKAMLEMAYADGIRKIIFTPHIRRPWIDNVSQERRQFAFDKAAAIAHEIGNDLEVYLGCEFYFSHEVVESRPELIKPINGTDYVLVEFSTGVHFNDMISALHDLLDLGYLPIIAHIERFACLVKDVQRVEHLNAMGMVLQTNASTITNPHDKEIKNFMKYVLDNHLIKLVGTDSHDLENRVPKMSDAYVIVSKKFGQVYANKIFKENAERILRGEEI